MEAPMRRDGRGLTSRPTWVDRPSASSTTGHVNGIHGKTNGRGEVQGRTNGVANARGRPTGLVNGIGYVNGVRLRTSRAGVIAVSDMRRVGAFIAASAILMIILGYYLALPTRVSSSFAIDGDMSEWASVPQYSDDVDNVPGHVDLVAYAFVEEPGRLFVYGRMRAPLFPGSEPSSVYLFVDDPTTAGYAIGTFDADFIGEVWGWGGQVRSTGFREWTGDPDRDNATSFRYRGDFAAASAGAEFEFAVTESVLDLDPARDLRFALAGRYDDHADVGLIVGRQPGGLLVQQRPLTNLVSTTAPILELRFRAALADVDVRSLAFDHAGGGTIVVSNPRFAVPSGQERTELVSLNPSSLPSGSFVTLRLRSVDAVVLGSSIPVRATLAGAGARVYVQAFPVGLVVDGLFNDWTSVLPDANETMPDSLDILDAAFAAPADAFFYTRTEGEILAGAILPERRIVPQPPSGSGSPSLPLRRSAGEDVWQVYVDSDDRDSVGLSIGGIQADRLVEVRGRMGQVTSSGLFAWNATTWRWDPRAAPVTVAFVRTELEASAPVAALGPFRNARAVFAMTDWSGRGDLSDVPRVPAGPSLAPGMGPSPEHAVVADEVKATELVNTPVIDGRCDTSLDEYSGGTTASNVFITFTVGRRDDTQFLYVCVRVTADTSAQINDWGEVIFDTLHNGGSAPQTDDKLFWLFGNGDNTLSSWQGNGASWDTTCPACDAGNTGRSRFDVIEIYEFKIRYSDVWGTLTPSPDQVAGFAIIVFNHPSTLYTWGGSSVNENVPNSWGHLIYPIPEFPLPLVAAGTAFVIPVLLRRRARRGESVR